MTSLPIMWLSIGDYQYSKDMPNKLPGSLKKFMESPELYNIGHNNECFSVPIFFMWIIYGCF